MQEEKILCRCGRNLDEPDAKRMDKKKSSGGPLHGRQISIQQRRQDFPGEKPILDGWADLRTVQVLSRVAVPPRL